MEDFINNQELALDLDAMLADITGISDEFLKVKGDEAVAMVRGYFASPELAAAFKKNLDVMHTMGYSKQEISEIFSEAFSKYLSIEDVLQNEQVSEVKATFLKHIIEDIKNFFNTLIATYSEYDVTFEIVKCRPDAKLPAYAHPADAGADVYSAEEVQLLPNETKLVPLGIKMTIPRGWQVSIRPRSGLSLKTGLRVANAPGTVDSGYADEVSVIVTNTSSAPITVHKGDRIAQFVPEKVYNANFVWGEEITGNNRGGGFGSTGLNG